VSEREGKRRGFVLSQASTPYAKEATFPRGAVASVATTVFLSSSLAGSITDTKQAHKFCDFKADTAKEELFFFPPLPLLLPSMDVVFSQLTQPAAQEEDPSQSQAVLRAGWGQLKGFGRSSRLVLLEPNREYILGRHSACDLVFQSAQVSNNHCAIIRLDKDHPSSHGVPPKHFLFSNEHPPTPLKNNDHHDKAKDKAKEKEKEPEKGVTAAAAVVGRLERHPSADKALVLLCDLSSNGTFVNGKVVGKGKQVALHHKDMISLATKNAQTASPDLCKLLLPAAGILLPGMAYIHWFLIPLSLSLVFFNRDKQSWSMRTSPKSMGILRTTRNCEK